MNHAAIGTLLEDSHNGEARIRFDDGHIDTAYDADAESYLILNGIPPITWRRGCHVFVEKRLNRWCLKRPML